jgi:hypothetical protein
MSRREVFPVEHDTIDFEPKENSKQYFWGIIIQS